MTIYVKLLKHIVLNTIENTLFIGKVLLHHKELDSTNLTATDYLSKNNPSEGTVISTYRQTAGRGQIGSKWESTPDKNLSFSIILYPDMLSAQRQFLLSQTISLGVYDFLSQNIATGLKIKWPNDIYVNDKKIGGILIQNALSGKKIQSAIVGIGLNINQKSFSENIPNPISLCQITKQEMPLDQLLMELCRCIDMRYRQLKDLQFLSIEKDYLRRLYKINQVHQFTDLADATNFTGKITGISSSGQLEIATSSGVRRFGLKEIRFS